MQNPNSISDPNPNPNNNKTNNGGSLTSEVKAAAAVVGAKEGCRDCGDHRGWWDLHNVRFRGILRRLCTSCVLSLHPAFFCPFCFAFHDFHYHKCHNYHYAPHHRRTTKPQKPRRPRCLISCSKCPSLSHAHCLPSALSQTTSSFLCPACASATNHSFDLGDSITKTDANGVVVIDKRHAAVLLCATEIAAASMSKAVLIASAEAERRVREATLARKRAREALNRLVTLSRSYCPMPPPEVCGNLKNGNLGEAEENYEAKLEVQQKTQHADGGDQGEDGGL